MGKGMDNSTETQHKTECEALRGLQSEVPFPITDKQNNCIY